MSLVKICGLTNEEDAQVAMELGADFLGFVNDEASPRYLTPDEIARIITEVDPRVPTVLVTHSQDVSQILNTFEAAGTNILQAHARLTLNEYAELKDYVPSLIANISVDASLTEPTPALREQVAKVSGIADYILLDTKFGSEIGGTGKTYDWIVAKDLMTYSQKPVIIAGGLNHINVSEVVRKLHPFTVDVSSGVESRVGQKDHEKLALFIRNAKSG